MKPNSVHYCLACALHSGHCYLVFTCESPSALAICDLFAKFNV